jgi:hypothetical protein
MPPIIVNDLTQLAASIAIAALGGGLIVLDGRPNAGKSQIGREIAKELGGVLVDADDYLDRNRGMFLGALRFDDLRRALADTAPPVLFSSVCARQVIEKLGLSAALVIWVEQASKQRLEQARRDFALDENADRADQSPLYKEVEAYIAACDARMRPDVVVYLNARD